MVQQPQFLLNGKKASEISLQDRGLHYGDGVFETLAVINGTPLLLDSHLQRLKQGCECLSILAPESELLKSEIDILSSNADKGVIKIILTRGVGGRGYMPPIKPKINRIVALFPMPEYAPDNYSQGIKLFLCKTRYGHNPQIAGIKHLNRIEQVLARSEWHDPDYFEGLVLDNDNNVIEGTMSNIFLVKEGTLFTPDISQCGIEGIIRKHVIELAISNGKNIHIKNIPLEQVEEADEVFICNSIIGIVSVRAFQMNTYDSFYYADLFRQKMISKNMIAPVS